MFRNSDRRDSRTRIGYPLVQDEGGRDLQQRIRDYANNRMATIPTYLIGSDCGMYIIGTDKSCELSGNGQIVFTNPTNSCVGVIVWKR